MLSVIKSFYLASLLLTSSSIAVNEEVVKPRINVERIETDYLNLKYQWGGNGPYRYDCSGFVQKVYRDIGIDLPRTSYTMVKKGIRVSKKNLQVGDLIFLKSKKTGKVNHVAIVVGKNKIIHAAKGPGKIVVTPLSRYNSTYYTARRILT